MEENKKENAEPKPRASEFTRADRQHRREHPFDYKRVTAIKEKWEKAGVIWPRVEQILRRAWGLYGNTFYSGVIGKSSKSQPDWFKNKRKDFLKGCSQAFRRFIKHGLTEEDEKLVNEHYGPFTLTRLKDALSEFQKGPLNMVVPIVCITEENQKPKKGRPPDQILGPLVVCLIELLKASGLDFNKGPREKRIRWKDLSDVLENYFPWEGPLRAISPNWHLDRFLIRDTYRHWKKRPLPPEWPKLETIRTFATIPIRIKKPVT